MNDEENLCTKVNALLCSSFIVRRSSFKEDPMNGNGKLTQWILASILAPGSLAIFGFIAKNTIDNSAKLAALEKDTEHRLVRIEKKLDRLLGDMP
jgi:hypothetical protein